MRTHATIFVAAAAMLASGVASANPWQIDTAHSEVGFTVRHLGLAKVKGKFTTYEATIDADKKTGKLASINGTVQIDSVDTGMEQRDAHLKAEDFFYATKFPTMTFKSNKVSFKGNQVTAVGDLTMRGVTKRVTFTGEYLGHHKVNFGNGDQIRTGYSLTTTINRKDFGLSFGAMAEGVSVVSDKVTINLDVELSRMCDDVCT